MAKKKTLKNDDIDEKKRLELYNSQYLIRFAEQRAYDLFLENLVKGTSHLSLGQEAIAAGFATPLPDPIGLPAGMTHVAPASLIRIAMIGSSLV